ncbi:MAG: hypothetical protein ABWX94_03010 [Candidatus Saccharimonadales bacterium]
MSESLQLICHKVHDEAVNGTGQVIYDDVLVVAGIEFSDGNRQLNRYHDPELVETPLELGWSEAKLDALASFHAAHFANTLQEGKLGKPWNCHSFVAAIMEWEVYWKATASAYNMKATSTIQPDALSDSKAYGVGVSRRHIEHSVMGLADTSQNLAVESYRGRLLVSSNDYTGAKYGETFWNYRLESATPEESVRLGYVGCQTELPDINVRHYANLQTGRGGHLR